MFIFTDRSRLHDFHLVADTRRIVFIMGLESGQPSRHFSVQWMRHQPRHGNDHGFVHVVADHSSIRYAPSFVVIAHHSPYLKELF